MRNKIIALLLILVMIGALVGCSLEQSESAPMHVYISGVGSDNISIVYYTTNLTQSTTTNITGIIMGNGSNVYYLPVPYGTISTVNDLSGNMTAHTALDTGVHGSGGDVLATDADITTHNALDTGVHGAGGDVLATDADIDTEISTHNALNTGVHGVGASTIVSADDVTADISAHAALTTSHGIAGNIVGTSDAQSLTNKTLTAPVINGVVSTTGLTMPSFYMGSNTISFDTGYGIKGYFTGQPVISMLGDGTTYSGFYLDPKTPQNNDISFVRMFRNVNTSGAKDISIYEGDGSSNQTLIIYPATGNLWAGGDVSALTFTDRTPYFEGDALNELIKFTGKDGEIDHKSLSDFVKVERVKPIYALDEKTIIGYSTQTERDLGATITLLTIAIKQLNERIEYLEGRVK